MKPDIVWLILVGIVSLARAGDPKPTAADFLALYATVPDDAFHQNFATGFEYEKVFSGEEKAKIVRGLYSGKPILTIEHIEKVVIETREIQTAPISGLRFVLNDSGIHQVRDYLRQPGAREMVVVIDGDAYATVSLDLAQKMSKERVLWVVRFLGRIRG